MLKVGSLFSGAGLCDLGLQWAGFRHQWFCEIDPFCRAVLARHWPGIPIYEDVKKLKGDALPSVDVLCGGFPCQDVSSGGLRAGIREGTRSGLWREYARLIGEIHPKYVIIENVRGLLSLGIDLVLNNLAAIGYDAEWEILPAAALGAPHHRERVFIVAYPTVMTFTANGYFLRSRESWASSTNLMMYLIGLAYDLKERERMPRYRHTASPSFIEGMMGVPEGWTMPDTYSLIL